jgi:hypothetical protein
MYTEEQWDSSYRPFIIKAFFSEPDDSTTQAYTVCLKLTEVEKLKIYLRRTQSNRIQVIGFYLLMHFLQSRMIAGLCYSSSP